MNNLLDMIEIRSLISFLTVSLLIVLMLFFSNDCQARTFGCFAGVLDASTDNTTEINYNHYQIFYNKKSKTDFLPFFGCGVSFDF